MNVGSFCPPLRVGRSCCPITYLVTAFIGIGGSLFGYDIGIVSGVLDMDAFQSVFADTTKTTTVVQKETTPTPRSRTTLTRLPARYAAPQAGKVVPALSDWRQGFIVTVFIGGNFLGALSSNFFADRYGRRSCLSIAALIFLVGGVLQCTAFEINQLFAGRCVA